MLDSRVEPILSNAEVLVRRGYDIASLRVGKVDAISKLLHFIRSTESTISDSIHGRVTAALSGLLGREVDRDGSKRNRIEWLLASSEIRQGIEQGILEECLVALTSAEVSDIAELASDGEERSNYQIRMASSLADRGDMDGAGGLFREAIEATRQMAVPRRLHCLAAVASAMITAGFLTEGWDLYGDILNESSDGPVDRAADAVSGEMFVAGGLLFSKAVALDPLCTRFRPDDFVTGVLRLLSLDVLNPTERP